MSVNIQGESDCGMPQILGNRLDVVAVLEADCGIAMAKIMEPDIAKTDAVQDLLQMVINRNAVKMLSKLVRKNQIHLIAEGVPCQQLPFFLLVLYSLQNIKNNRCW